MRLICIPYNCRLTGVDRTWMDEVCSMENLSFGNLINEFEIGMISANENGEVVDQFYDVSNVTLSLEILGDGQYSINASGMRLCMMKKVKRLFQISYLLR